MQMAFQANHIIAQQKPERCVESGSKRAIERRCDIAKCVAWEEELNPLHMRASRGKLSRRTLAERPQERHPGRHLRRKASGKSGVGAVHTMVDQPVVDRLVLDVICRARESHRW